MFDDFRILRCRGSCLKGLTDLKMSTGDAEKIHFLDLQNDCLRKLSHGELSTYENLKILDIKNQKAFNCVNLSVFTGLKLLSDCGQIVGSLFKEFC